MAGKIPETNVTFCGDDEENYNEDPRSECSLLSLNKMTFESRRKKLLVFDLNGLLVYKVYRSNKAKVPSDLTPDGKFGNFLVFKRPFAEEFVQFCLERFEIGIWSSALDDDDFYNYFTASGNTGSRQTGDDSSLSLEKLNIKPSKKLLVLGLNGLLVYRVYRFNKARFPTTRDHPDGRYGFQLVFRRPFAREFIEFCLESFEVAIWSCAEERGKVKGVLDCGIGILNRSKLSVVFDIHDCIESGLMSLEDKKKSLVFKRLDKMWNYFQRKYSESDTLLIDDQPYQALLNPPHTSVFMESYNPDNALDPKGELGVYLDGLAAANDVHVYVKENPFGLPSMSNDHPDWNFNTDIVR